MFVKAPATLPRILRSPFRPVAPPLNSVKRFPQPFESCTLVAIVSANLACVSNAVTEVRANNAPVIPEMIGIIPPKSDPNADATPVKEESAKLTPESFVEKSEILFSCCFAASETFS